MRIPPAMPEPPAARRTWRRSRRTAGLAGTATLAVSLVALSGIGTPAEAGGLETELVNRNTAGQQATGGISRFPSVSTTALIVSFDSLATNLVAGDTNGARDVFVRYRGVPQTIRASVSNTGAQANGDSGRPSMDDSAQFAAFESTATNLVSGDTNNAQDIFVRGLLANPGPGTRRVSVSGTGAQANGGSGSPSISAGAQVVAFTSLASNLVAGDTNGAGDIFVHDLASGATSRVSVSSTGVQGNALSSLPSVSGNGRYVAFVSAASNLVTGDTNNAEDVFVHDRDTGTTTRVSVGSGGVQANGHSSSPSIDEGGRYVAFTSSATNLVAGDTNGQSDVFLHHTIGGTTTRASVSSAGAQGNSGSSSPVVNADGRYVAFASDATNLVAGDTNLIADIFRWDRDTGQTERWSVATDGSQASAGTGSGQPAIGDSGWQIAFVSNAANLVPGDTLLSQDVFLRHS